MGKKNNGWDYLNSNDINDTFNEGESGDWGYTNSDGSSSYHGGDGSWGYTNSDGSGSYYGADGSWGYKNADGSGSYHGADGSWGYTNSDGSGSYYGADGSWGYKNADGSGSFYGGDDSLEDTSHSSISSNKNDSNDSKLGAVIGLGILGVAVGASKKRSMDDSNYCDDNYDDQKEITKRMENEKKAKERALKRKIWAKKHWKGIVASILAFVVIIITALGIYQYRRLIPVGYDLSELIGDNYENVEEKLKDGGFLRVYTACEADLSIDEIAQEFLVTDIQIGKKNSFSENNKFFPETEITITYHTVAKISTPMSAKEAKGLNYKDVIKAYEEAGFINIEIQVEYDIIMGWISEEGEVESVVIGENKKYNADFCARPDEKIVITYHDLKKNKPK